MAYLPLDKYTRRSTTTKLIIHCSATWPSMKCNADIIRKWHLAKGWLDIGYHYVINRDGSLEQGRPTWAVGAHAEGYNTTSIGVCLVGGCPEGNANAQENNFTPAQWERLERVVASILCTHPKIPRNTEGILGHRDLPGVKKFCPSFDVAKWWKERNKQILKHVQ